jgi:purine-binding chemotaxis protein CheW
MGSAATLAQKEDTVSMCLLRAGSGLFGIDTGQIREVLGTTSSQPVPLAPDYIDGVIGYRGEVLPTVSFRALLGLERRVGANCVVILDEENEENQKERFGLVIDGVGGVVIMVRNSLEPNPSALDERSLTLFGGIYRTPLGLMVRLDPQRLRPSRLAETGLFGDGRNAENGDSNESTYR